MRRLAVGIFAVQLLYLAAGTWKYSTKPPEPAHVESAIAATALDAIAHNPNSLMAQARKWRGKLRSNKKQAADELPHNLPPPPPPPPRIAAFVGEEAALAVGADDSALPAEDGDATVETAVAADDEPAADEPAADDSRPAARVATDPPRCVEKIKGYWSFEVCFGEQVQQFHAFVKDGKRSHVTSLGSHVPSLDAPGVQRFQGGEVCKETKRPRESTVTLRCGRQDRIIATSEEQPCQYILDVEARAFCE